MEHLERLATPKQVEQATLTQRLRVTIRGAVQGVGFRPFVYRVATELGLSGWVSNSSQGVFIEVEGNRRQLELFLQRIRQEKPPRSFIQSLESSFLDPIGYAAFEIRESTATGKKTALILPDIATCPECLQEVLDKADRRYLYPFTNCTNCGPRFSIIEALPYDRSNTTMRNFQMCDECRKEYENPLDRRFHAQPNACPRCGPHLELWNHNGHALAMHHEALLAAADAIRQGAIVALKGLGGFHLIVDARNEEAVLRLRQRKHREEKPLALMFPSLDAVRAVCEVSDLEEQLLLSPESPIVLLRRKSMSGRLSNSDFGIAPSVAPNNPNLGIMLPYTPLHHILMFELRFPIVATSGNLSDEPICTDEYDALERLGKIADLFLVHNRPIARHVDDSIVRVVMGRELVLRRARGYAPLPLPLGRVNAKPYPKEGGSARPFLAVGAHLKNSVAVSSGHEVFISQHIGDLETVQAFNAFKRVVQDMEHLYELQPSLVACDAHPDYLSTQFAEQHGLPLIRVQHHEAHILSCMAENELEGKVLGVSWDGTGYGLDGTIWGGEFLLTEWDSSDNEDRDAEPPEKKVVKVFSTSSRIAHLRPFMLPGGERAIKEPRRTAIGVLYEVFSDELFHSKRVSDASDIARVLPLRAFSTHELDVLQIMLKKKLNAPVTSSAGRLFDAVAAIVGLRQEIKYEGQAAMELEFALDGVSTEETYEFTIHNGHSTMIVDWEPMIRGIINDLHCGVPVGHISAKFHNTLAEMVVEVARYVGEERVVLTGGCFQNRYLTERVILRLRGEGFKPYWHQRVPPNDGGIALGQAFAATRFVREH